MPGNPVGAAPGAPGKPHDWEVFVDSVLSAGWCQDPWAYHRPSPDQISGSHGRPRDSGDLASYFCGDGKGSEQGSTLPRVCLAVPSPACACPHSSFRKCRSCSSETLQRLHGLLGTGVHQDESLNIHWSPALGGAAAEPLRPGDRFLSLGSFQDEAANPGLKYGNGAQAGGPRREHTHAMAARRYPSASLDLGGLEVGRRS